MERGSRTEHLLYISSISPSISLSLHLSLLSSAASIPTSYFLLPSCSLAHSPRDSQERSPALGTPPSRTSTTAPLSIARQHNRPSPFPPHPHPLPKTSSSPSESPSIPRKPTTPSPLPPSPITATHTPQNDTDPPNPACLVLPPFPPHSAQRAPTSSPARTLPSRASPLALRSVVLVHKPDACARIRQRCPKRRARHCGEKAQRGERHRTVSSLRYMLHACIHYILHTHGAVLHKRY